MATKKSPGTAQSPLPGGMPMPRPSEDAIPRWGQVDEVVIRAFIAAFCEDGHAVLFGTTKDITALTLTMYVRDEKVSYVYGHAQAAENALREYTEWAMTFRGYVAPE
jgi:hypothetical protein